MKNLSPINEEKDLVNKKYVDNSLNAVDEQIEELNNADMNLAKSIGQNSTDITTLEKNIQYLRADLLSLISANTATLGYKVKNLLKVTAASQTVNGITFTVNADKSVTINGTSTAQAIFHINQKVGLPSGTTYNVCSPSSSASTSKYYAEIYNASWGNRKVVTTSNVEVSTGIGIYRIVVPSGVTLSNVTVYPMIVSENETDTSFEAYIGDVNTRLAAIEESLGLA